jgi:hypothetical protein
MMKRVVQVHLDFLVPAASVVAHLIPYPSFVKNASFKSTVIVSFLIAILFSVPAPAMVFINEAFVNPPGGSSFDAVREFVELAGTPGMKLDGYAVAVLNGTGQKYYPAGTIPPVPIPTPEIDEFFSLDGLTLGDNGLLALLVTVPDYDRYPDFYYSTTDALWVNWNGLWNGGRDFPGTINNDGSVTILLIRNRPGATEADPTNPAGLIWGKEIRVDEVLLQDVYYDEVLGWMDQWGDGHIDIGDPNGMGGNSLDMTGVYDTPGDLSDDLEIVDEVSFEDDAGHEYDTDDRHVDFNSTDPGFPHRHVHSLDNPIGFNPDALTRVDYRTTGPGWTPAAGATGEMTSGNNWQDMATEQWIRGGSLGPYEIIYSGRFCYDNGSEPVNPIQPYETNVPLWLSDGLGADFDFGTAQSYCIIAGLTNPLCVPVIPGDVNRDGDCDSDDIAKIASVFGDDDWIFSNSFAGSPEGSEVDPATQTKPWDLDGTGDNGIEASDFQWVLNFQGDTTGHIVGIRYDSPTPAATGVRLNSNAAVTCSIGTSVYIPSGRTASTLLAGDTVEITVSSQITAGANSTAGQENGIMQYVHDIFIDTSGVLETVSITSLGAFSKTNAALEAYQGTNGDLGVDLVNGYTTSFTEGLSGPADLYKVTLEVVGMGSAAVTIDPAAEAKFAASTPGGVKIGHTDNHGNPAISVYPASLSFAATIVGDITGNYCVDLADYARISAAWLSEPGDGNWDADCDISPPVDLIDVGDLTTLVENWSQGCGS